MTHHRTSRIGEEIKRELSQMVREEIKDPRVKGLISVTQVDVTNDLRYAKVYVSVYSKNPEEIKDSIAGLESAGGYLRSELAKRISLRFTPELIFKPDTSMEYGTKINNILLEINKNEGTGQSDDGME